MNGDTSWLITVVEIIRSGGRAYVDAMEPNPPMAFLIYWPAVAMAGYASLSPEAAVYLLTGLVAIVSIMLSMGLVTRHFRLASGGAALFGATLVVVFFLMPSRTFTQREHLALMLLLPGVICLAARAADKHPALPVAVMCGLLGGVGATIKPHFILVLLLPALTGAVIRRDWRMILVPETLTAGACFTAYVALWVIFYPQYFNDPLFVAQNSYRLYAFGPLDYLTNLSSQQVLICVAVGLGLAVTLRQQPEIMTLFAALLAFALAFMEQGKGFAYHLYSVVAAGLILAAFAAALAQPRVAGKLTQGRALGLLVVLSALAAMSTYYSWIYPDSRELRQALLREKPKPSLIILTFDIGVNFPLARQIDARWASRLQSTWISNSAGHAIAGGLAPAQRARTDQAILMERDWILADISRNMPDLIVVDTHSPLEHITAYADFKAVIARNYKAAEPAQGGRFAIFRRKAA